MARRFLTLPFAFAAMALGIEGIRRAVDGWRGTIPGALDFVSIASLPPIARLWGRYLSPFGKGRGQCLSLPERASDCGRPAPSSHG